MSDPILFSVDEGMARLTLNRPARLNAFNADLAYAWRDATAEAVGRSDVRAVLIDAAGPAFCAGGDVIDMATSMGAAEDITALAEVINEGIRSLTDSAVPVVAAAHGTTAGGGLGILLSSDYAVVGSRSKLGSLYANIGLTPDLSVSAQLARAIGQRRALQLVLQDRLLSAAEAVEWGLIAESAEAYGQAKRLVRSQPERSFAEQLSEEARTIGSAMMTPDAQERIAAFAAASARKSG
jgi:2-(1,2-epoxy-1,2-dihydrophenyl)acetyl-CoA isomerase